MVRVLDELIAVHDCPSAVLVDNGPEFNAQTFADWCTAHGAAIHYIQTGKPDQNAYIECFNRSYRTEVLNASLRVGRRTAGADRHLVADLQQRAAS